MLCGWRGRRIIAADTPPLHGFRKVSTMGAAPGSADLSGWVNVCRCMDRKRQERFQSGQSKGRLSIPNRLSKWRSLRPGMESGRQSACSIPDVGEISTKLPRQSADVRRGSRTEHARARAVPPDMRNWICVTSWRRNSVMCARIPLGLFDRADHYRRSFVCARSGRVRQTCSAD